MRVGMHGRGGFGKVSYLRSSDKSNNFDWNDALTVLRRSMAPRALSAMTAVALLAAAGLLCISGSAEARNLLGGKIFHICTQAVRLLAS